ncbi:flagellar hook-associated protein FlgK [Thioclava sp. F1Mire-8]|uniref:flagellar hook-associated protein FlgK n=1 Tax=Thioclava sp. F1Mire-8 TaxID=1973006 RepID=UPI000B5475B5|nr:flagellar hook-associated protein FlgK [Thioclava sp. F1Mire-8]OWY02783.1 flagellar hook-associated protein FlgK [Thioclava sp. F1Mire-8]
MGISQTLSNALSGLTAASRMAEVVASNTANALTEGYARREVSLGAQMVGRQGAGVRVLSVNRIVNETLRSDLRLSEAATQNASIRYDFLSTFEARIGTPEDASSLSSKFAQFEASLVEAGSRPESEARLATVLDSARAVTDHLNALSAHLQDSRMTADRQIAAQVDTLNTALSQVDELNASILAGKAAGHDTNALKDQRQTLVDQISSIVPIRQATRENDQIALFTTGGAALLEGNPVEIGFTSTGIITPDMTYVGGTLSGLTLNGNTVSMDEGGFLGGGSLGALFTIRDTLAPDQQIQIDALSRDLIERVSDPAIDPTLSGGTAGLFTDDGGPLDPLDETGLAGRIAINPLADPEQGGALSLLRDGLGAASPGPVSNAENLFALASAFTTPSAPSSGNFGSSHHSSAELFASFLSQVTSDRQRNEATQTYAKTRYDTLKEQALADGVDTDHEMQKLLQIEELYSANARVIQTADALIKQLLEI